MTANEQAVLASLWALAYVGQISRIWKLALREARQ